MKLPVYLDNNATTPVDPRVIEAMLPYFNERFGNASSKGHPYGWAADEAVEQARGQVAGLLSAEAREIVFTSGATEAANLAIKGVAEAYAAKGRHIVTTQIEHRAVLESCKSLERRGFRVTYVPVSRDGVADPEAVVSALTDETILVCVMWANNEIGTVQPIEEIAAHVRTRGILLMTDATQAVGKLPITTEHVDLLVCSGHKFYGPKGIGALYVRARTPHVHLPPLLNGGGQERGLRAGTLNVPGIVGMGAAAALARGEMAEEQVRSVRLRDGLEAALVEAHVDVRVNGQGVPRLPQTSSLTFEGVRAEDLTVSLRNLAFSAGSACSSGSSRPSHVLQALGLTDEQVGATLRISMGRFTTEEEADFAAGEIGRAVRKLRGAEQVTVG